VTGDCGHPVTKLVCFKCAKCLSDMLDMYSDNSYCVVARLLHVYTFSVLKSSVQTEIVCMNAQRESYITEA
jgi:hypothetical protein